jgi:hypothetical protein
MPKLMLFVPVYIWSYCGGMIAVIAESVEQAERLVQQSGTDESQTRLVDIELPVREEFRGFTEGEAWQDYYKEKEKFDYVSLVKFRAEIKTWEEQTGCGFNETDVWILKHTLIVEDSIPRVVEINYNYA